MADGVSILIYGDPGLGKTTDVGYTFRKACWIQTEPGGLYPVERCVGYKPTNVHTLFDVDAPDKELKELMNKTILPGIKKGELKTVVLDSGSAIAERMIGAFLKRMPDGRQAYQAVQNEIVQLMGRIVASGVWFIMICNAAPPSFEDKTMLRLRGGPLFPGTKLPRIIPPKFDLVLYATASAAIGKKERVYIADPLHPDWIAKDRFGVTLDVQPMELAPIVWRIQRPGEPVPEELMVKKLIKSV